jgi:hypothetical protein
VAAAGVVVVKATPIPKPEANAKKTAKARILRLIMTQRSFLQLYIYIKSRRSHKRVSACGSFRRRASPRRTCECNGRSKTLVGQIMARTRHGATESSVTRPCKFSKPLKKHENVLLSVQGKRVHWRVTRLVAAGLLIGRIAVMQRFLDRPGDVHGAADAAVPGVPIKARMTVRTAPVTP